MRIYDCKVNHLTNPVGFRMERTAFSWKTDGAVGKFQTAARIEAASDPEFTKIIYDSGFDEKADSLACPADIRLEPRTRIWWRVSVRTDAGEEGTSPVQFFETSKMDEPWCASWISCSKEEERHPVFIKKIKLKKRIERARLYICGLGLYEAGIDGQKIGNEYLTPYCNDYNEWVQYQTFDVTEALNKDFAEKAESVFSVLLGNGWYKGRFGFTTKEEKGFYGDSWKLIAELRLTYEDGAEAVIGTDDSWTVERSCLTYSSIYGGEIRDDTLNELPEEKAVLCDAPKGRLTARMSLPVTVHEILPVREIIITPDGEKVLDIGQEFTGIFRLHVKVPAGTKVHLQTGEILQGGNFYRDNLRSARSEYIYISDGQERELEPKFTFYGYRYVKVDGIPNLKKEDFTGLALYSGIGEVGRAETGSVLVNRLLSNIRWGLRSNFLDVPTDCPQRDERMGWTGDAQVISPTACYLLEPYAFYAKYLHDMAEEQKSLDGKVPQVVPSVGNTDTSSVWGDAACIIPWNLYSFYGDISILQDQYESMKAWVEYVRGVDGSHHGWRNVFQYGDWLALDNIAGGAETAMGGTDEEFIADIAYAESAGILSRSAALLGRNDDADEYDRLSKNILQGVRDEYFSKTGRCCVKTQTGLLLTLKYHLSDNEELICSMLRKLFKAGDNKLRTGFVGTPILCDTLSDYGMDDLSWALLLNEEYPGWLHEVKLGATTVWERWNSVQDDGSISGTGMNSLNHYTYGSIAEWIYSHAAGIARSPEVPGFRKAVLKPSLNWKIRFVSAEYESPSGTYKSSWKMTAPSHVEYRCTIPFGCTARLELPLEKEGRVKMLDAGDYEFSYETAVPLRKSFSIDTPIKDLIADPEVSAKLAGILPLAQVPPRAQMLSLRVLNEKFGARMTEEQLEGINALLKSI
ncbi:MAG TPA: family 78 glycoside hydrolase catalytic domain [Lachnospiraceae bacterium]|nr:family 78 glycoside hydrolase catalytic domain [Lachnospiraceae bacterium]